MNNHYLQNKDDKFRLMFWHMVETLQQEYGTSFHVGWCDFTPLLRPRVYDDTLNNTLFKIKDPVIEYNA